MTSLENVANKDAHYGRIADRNERIAVLRKLLAADDKSLVLRELEEGGYIKDENREAMSQKSIEEVRADIMRVIEQMQIYNNEVPGLARAVKEGLASSTATISNPVDTEQNKLNKNEKTLDPDSPEAKIVISTVKTRFEALEDEKLKKTVNWTEVENSLRASPEDLYSLHKLEETGGEPQLIGTEGDEFIFEDRSKESPSGRRNLNFYQADTQRKTFGRNVSFQSPEAYRSMQLAGKYDLETWSWLATDDANRDAGRALYGDRLGAEVRVNERLAVLRRKFRGWRAALRVKKA